MKKMKSIKERIAEYRLRKTMRQFERDLDKSFIRTRKLIENSLNGLDRGLIKAENKRFAKEYITAVLDKINDSMNKKGINLNDVSPRVAYILTTDIVQDFLIRFYETVIVNTKSQETMDWYMQLYYVRVYKKYAKAICGMNKSK